MRTHVKIIAWLYIISGALGFMGALLAGIFISMGGWISGDRTAILVLTIISLVIGGIIAALAVPSVIAGIGLLGQRNWARVLAIIVAILNLPAFPIGTLLGAYTLYVMLDNETSTLFN